MIAQLEKVEEVPILKYIMIIDGDTLSNVHSLLLMQEDVEMRGYSAVGCVLVSPRSGNVRISTFERMVAMHYQFSDTLTSLAFRFFERSWCVVGAHAMLEWKSLKEVMEAYLEPSEPANVWSFNTKDIGEDLRLSCLLNSTGKRTGYIRFTVRGTFFHMGAWCFEVPRPIGGH